MSLPTKGITGNGLSMATKGVLSSMFAGAIWQPIVLLVTNIIRSISLDIER